MQYKYYIKKKRIPLEIALTTNESHLREGSNKG
jgi:hypothetical protein